VRAGDVVTVRLDSRVRIMRVIGFCAQRGSAEAARRIYEDVAPGRPCDETAG
jgi:ribosome-associated heat shock protein Hsp15